MEHPVREFRTRNGISLKALARDVEADKSTLSRVETGEQEASVDLLRRLRARTGISGDALLDWKPPR